MKPSERLQNLKDIFHTDSPNLEPGKEKLLYEILDELEEQIEKINGFLVL